MKSILISIKPKRCELIASGEKTIEVRKTRPAIEKVGDKFKCYIYCTKAKQRLSLNGSLFCFEDDLAILNRPGMPKIGNPWGALSEDEMLINGKVIGEFVCDDILDCLDVDMDDTCLTVKEWLDYSKGHLTMYGWHISNLIIYDKPKELTEFCKTGFESIESLAIEEELCKYCSPTDYGEHSGYSTPNGYVSCEGSYCEEAYQAYLDENFVLTRPPRSWCYVEKEDG